MFITRLERASHDLGVSSGEKVCFVSNADTILNLYSLLATKSM